MCGCMLDKQSTKNNVQDSHSCKCILNVQRIVLLCMYVWKLIYVCSNVYFICVFAPCSVYDPYSDPVNHEGT